MTHCEISGCSGRSVCTEGGVSLCERCWRGFVSVGHGAVRFGGRWHGVRGSTYTTAQAGLFPGLVGGGCGVHGCIGCRACGCPHDDGGAQ